MIGLFLHDTFQLYAYEYIVPLDWAHIKMFQKFAVHIPGPICKDKAVGNPRKEENGESLVLDDS
jgi:hypothetical protein